MAFPRPRLEMIPSIPPPPPSEVERDRASIKTQVEVARNEQLEAERGERRALAWAAFAAFATIVWIVMPIGVGILLGTLLAFLTQPLFERLKPRLGKRWAALAVVLASTLTLAATIGGLASLFISRGTVLTRTLIASLGHDAPGGGVVAAAGRLTSRFGMSPEQLAKRTRALAEAAAASAQDIAQVLMQTTATALLALFFATLSMHYILCNWQAMSLRAKESLPLRPVYTAELFIEFQRVGRTTLFGTIVTGLAQGVLATIGYWICGVPEAIFFGAATGVAALIPAIGTMLVWLPAGVMLILQGHPVRGIFELAWGLFIVVGLSDYVIRPRLVGGEGDMPSLVTFAALFGGVAVFGLKGLVIGPVMIAVSMAVLRLYAAEARRRRSHLHAESGTD